MRFIHHEVNSKCRNIPTSSEERDDLCKISIMISREFCDKIVSRETEDSCEEVKINQEESSGSESESSSDSDTYADSISEVDEQTFQFAMMANTSVSTESDQVVDECCASHSKCFNCIVLKSKVLAYQNHNVALISDLNQCIDANKVLKSNEKDFQAKIKLLNKQLHEAEIAVLNKQDDVTSYLNTINETKKNFSIVECDYETLAQKLTSYESSSYIIERMISKGTYQKGKGKESYLHFPPPILNSFVNSPDDKDVKVFQVKTALVIDPIGMITDEGSSLSEESFVEGIVEDWVVVLKGDPISSSKVYQSLSFVKASKENEACVSDKINNLVPNGKKGLGFNESDKC
ncbi:hypothetical protein R6Q57_011597 [Mikania cordata]